MAVTGFFHHIGTFLLLAATILLIVTDITAPVINGMGILKVDTPLGDRGDQTQVSFGTFGWCILNDYSNGADGMDSCTGKKVGYNPADALVDVTNADFSQYAEDSTAVLSRVMVLHPVATGMAFISFLLALGSGLVGSLLASLLACLTFLTTLSVLICDFILFGIIKSNVNNASSDGQGNGRSHAHYSIGMWTTLAATICLLIASILVFFACCSKRLKKRHQHKKTRGSISPPASRRRRRNWMFWKKNRRATTANY